MANDRVGTSDNVGISISRGDIGKTPNIKPQSAWVRDVAIMHAKFGVNPIVSHMDSEKLKEYLQFRIGCLQEELDELKDAKTADDAVDALLDLCVFAVGTLEAFNVNADIGWGRIHEKNMEKTPGIKAERPNKYGFPDLIKGPEWVPPTHADNVGLFSKVY